MCIISRHAATATRLLHHRVVPVLYPLFTVPLDSDIAHAHNIFLQTALDLGIPGLVAYLALLIEIWGIIKLRG
jgi:O-antigen ligase